MGAVRFTPQAVADLEEVKRYVSNDLFNPVAAADLVALVFEKIRKLASFPQSGTRLKTDIPALQLYRFILCKNYLVFYRVEAKYVSIIRIIYAKRNYLALLDADNMDDH